MLKRLLAALLTVLGIHAKAAGPDFSEVDSLAKAQQLYRDGKLEKLYLFPLDLGGEDISQNIVYVPVGIGQFKAQLDGTVRKMVEAGSVSKYSATPEYKGKSFIPSKIVIRAWHPEKPGSFNPTIEVW
jgi:hypothetical protein